MDVRVSFADGPLKGKALTVPEKTARRGVLQVLHPVYVKRSCTLYRLEWSDRHGWVGTVR